MPSLIKNFPRGMAHHIKGLRPALELMLSLGVNTSQCLAGTGIQLQDLDDASASFSHAQEFRFYRNILLAKPDEPLLGLRLGAAYKPESYGLLGYAMLSADTMGEALNTAVNFGLLTFSHFTLRQEIDKTQAIFAFEHQYELPEDLLWVYSDRDVQAAVTAMEASCHRQDCPTLIRLVHRREEFKAQYEEHFACPVELGYYRNELIFERELLDTPLPQRDAQTSQYCRQQCEQLMRTLSQQGRFIDKVRSIIIAQPGQFPSIEAVASELQLSVRSLRRRLAEENSGYQQLLNEIRQQLAKDYLQTQMPIEQIAELLGYSEAANFSHAFKRWFGQSPKAFRQLP